MPLPAAAGSGELDPQATLIAVAKRELDKGGVWGVSEWEVPGGDGPGEAVAGKGAKR